MNMEDGLNLTLGLPGTDESNKDSCFKSKNKRCQSEPKETDTETAPATKSQVVGWPPVRNYRKKNEGGNGVYVKVSMDGAPYLRKIDLKVYKDYSELLKALENMFKLNVGLYSERDGCKYAPTYEDKDGDWMLLGDVPWEMFILSCKRMRIMKGDEGGQR